MRAKIEVTVAVLLLGSTALMLAGCQAATLAMGVGTRLASEDTVVIKPEYEIGKRPIVVIPFRDTSETHYASRDGLDLATYVVGELANRRAAQNIVPDTGVRETFGDGVAAAGWDKIAQQTGAELVLTGTIDQFRLKDPKTYLMLRGNCIVTTFLYDAKSKTVVHRITRLEVWVPDWGPGIPEGDIEPERLREQLLAVTAMKIVQKYYKWEKKTGPDMNRL